MNYDAAGRIHAYGDTITTIEQVNVCDDPMDLNSYHWVDVPTYTPVRTEVFVYDSVGNRKDHSAVISTGNRLTSFNGATMTYDDDGFLLTKTSAGHSQTLHWNGFGQLDSATTDGCSRPSATMAWGAACGKRRPARRRATSMMATTC